MEHMSKDLTSPQYLDSSVQPDSPDVMEPFSEVRAMTLMETSENDEMFDFK